MGYLLYQVKKNLQRCFCGRFKLSDTFKVSDNYRSNTQSESAADFSRAFRRATCRSARNDNHTNRHPAARAAKIPAPAWIGGISGKITPSRQNLCIGHFHRNMDSSVSFQDFRGRGDLGSLRLIHISISACGRRSPHPSGALWRDAARISASPRWFRLHRQWRASPR